MRVTLQYFDGCPGWQTTDGHLAALRAEGLDLEVAYEKITTPAAAVLAGFRGSPTLLIDGVDPFADAEAAVGLTCRIYLTAEGVAASPTLAEIRKAVTAV